MIQAVYVIELGKLTILSNFTVPAVTTALCHCSDCQKWGGAGYSSNIAIPTSALQITGTPVHYARKGLSGKEHTLSFCGTCGTSLYSQQAGMPGVTLIKTGSLNDAADRNMQVAVELFCKDRVGFDSPVDGAKQQRMDMGGPSM